MRKPDFSIIMIVCAVIVIVTIAFYSISKSSVPKQSESHKIEYLRDELLLESTKTLDEIDKRLERMEQDIREIREKLTAF